MMIKVSGLALAYVQARAIQNRLDELFGVDGWTVSYKGDISRILYVHYL